MIYGSHPLYKVRMRSLCRGLILLIVTQRSVQLFRVSISSRKLTSEWTTLHSKSPAVWLGFSHTAPSFLLFPTKLCCANFRGDPALRAKEGSRHQFHHANAKIPNARAFGIFPYSPFTFHSSLILCSPLGIFRSE